LANIEEDIFMTDIADLERRLRIIEDKEAIKRVKAKYMWCNDKKLWTDLIDCFTEDAYVQYGTEFKLYGAKAEAEFLASRGVGRPSSLSIHHLHNEEIDIINDREAKARWQVYVYVIDEEARSKRVTAGYYEEDYVKENGQWKIKRLVLTPFLVEDSSWAGHL
jgi:hypothetical protein